QYYVMVSPHSAPRGTQELLMSGQKRTAQAYPDSLRLLAVLTAISVLTPGTALAKDQSSVSVEVIRTPNGGIQPQALVDAKGVLHLVYFKGDPAAGDLFYVSRAAGDKDFSSAIRVNSQPGSAIAIGTIRGGQIALGKGGR